MEQRSSFTTDEGFDVIEHTEAEDMLPQSTQAHQRQDRPMEKAGQDQPFGANPAQFRAYQNASSNDRSEMRQHEDQGGYQPPESFQKADDGQAKMNPSNLRQGANKGPEYHFGDNPSQFRAYQNTDSKGRSEMRLKHEDNDEEAAAQAGQSYATTVKEGDANLHPAHARAEANAAPEHHFGDNPAQFRAYQNSDSQGRSQMRQHESEDGYHPDHTYANAAKEDLDDNGNAAPQDDDLHPQHLRAASNSASSPEPAPTNDADEGRTTALKNKAAAVGQQAKAAGANAAAAIKAQYQKVAGHTESSEAEKPAAEGEGKMANIKDKVAGVAQQAQAAGASASAAIKQQLTKTKEGLQAAHEQAQQEAKAAAAKAETEGNAEEEEGDAEPEEIEGEPWWSRPINSLNVYQSFQNATHPTAQSLLTWERPAQSGIALGAAVAMWYCFLTQRFSIIYLGCFAVEMLLGASIVVHIGAALSDKLFKTSAQQTINKFVDPYYDLVQAYTIDLLPRHQAIVQAMASAAEGGSYVVSRARTWLRCDSIIDSIMAFFGLRILVNVLSVFSIPMLLLMTVVYGFSVPVLFKHFGRQIDQVVCPVLETVRGFTVSQLQKMSILPRVKQE